MRRTGFGFAPPRSERMAVSRHRDHDLDPFEPDETSRQTARVLDLAGAVPGKVLDLGCGDGRVASSLVRQGHRVVGLDLDGEVETTFLTATDPNGEFHRGDLRVDDEDKAKAKAQAQDQTPPIC